MKTDTLTNRIAALNILNAYINEKMPLVRARAAQGYKRKADGSLFKKDADDFAAIVADAPERIHQAHVTCNPYATSGPCVVFRQTYMTSAETCAYLENSFYFAPDAEWIPLPIYSLDQCRKDDAKLDGIEKQIEALKDEYRAIAKITRGRYSI